jgi:exopolyphosphatase/pppGpp-phosphohydrolase
VRQESVVASDEIVSEGVKYSFIRSENEERSSLDIVDEGSREAEYKEQRSEEPKRVLINLFEEVKNELTEIQVVIPDE